MREQAHRVRMVLQGTAFLTGADPGFVGPEVSIV